jgi:hypothetical protein
MTGTLFLLNAALVAGTTVAAFQLQQSRLALIDRQASHVYVCRGHFLPGSCCGRFFGAEHGAQGRWQELAVCAKWRCPALLLGVSNKPILAL